MYLSKPLFPLFPCQNALLWSKGLISTLCLLLSSADNLNANNMDLDHNNVRPA